MNGVGDVFVYDRIANTTTRVSLTYTGNEAVGGHSSNPVISDDGRFVAFESTAYNLVPYGGTSNPNVYLYDRQATSDLSRTIKLSSGVGYQPSISKDGRYIAFQASYNPSTSPYDIYLYDRISGVGSLISRPVSQPAQGNSTGPTISADGNYIIFASYNSFLVSKFDTTISPDAFVYNRTTSSYARVSVYSDGAQIPGGMGDLAISETGRYVSFRTYRYGPYELPDSLFVHTLENSNGDGRTIRTAMVWTPDTLGHSVISKDGRYISFDTSQQLIPSDTGGWSDVYIAPSELGWTDTLALFNTNTRRVTLIDTLQTDPPSESYTSFDSGVPEGAIGGQWVMGDWNGDGQKTPGVYGTNGVFYTTNVLDSTTPAAAWNGTWFGFFGRPAVVGRFSTSAANDCLGVVDSGDFPPYGTAYTLYYTCNLFGGNPPKSFQWLSVLLPDSQGHTGDAQFVAGDYDVDGFDSIAIRRSAFIAFTNVTPSQGNAAFQWAQYIGAPSSLDYGYLVAGDWDNTGTDSFGLVYQNGDFYRRNDLEWNTEQYLFQHVDPQSLGTPLTLMAASWRLEESYVGGE